MKNGSNYRSTCKKHLQAVLVIMSVKNGSFVLWCCLICSVTCSSSPLAPSFSEQSHIYAEVVDANRRPNGMIALTMRLNGGVSGKRRKCSALRRGGSERKREKFLMRKKEERIRMMKKLNGGKDDMTESAEDLPDDMVRAPYFEPSLIPTLSVSLLSPSLPALPPILTVTLLSDSRSFEGSCSFCT